MLILALLACAPAEEQDSGPPPCTLAEGSWSLAVSGTDKVCTGGLETATGADVSLACTDPDNGVSSFTWTANDIGYAITCTNAEGGVHCAYGGLSLDATVNSAGTSLEGTYSGPACSDAWKGETEGV